MITVMVELFAVTFLWALGLCVGSFLNVVVYRLGAGLSIATPRWSFCPACHSTIRGYDNVPIVSWFVLRGRCRACSAPISPQYPLVEAATGLAFVLTYWLLFPGAAHARLEFELMRDAPFLVAWLIMVGCLAACTAMDIASYSIDVRVTNLAVAAAAVALALWPRGEVLIADARTPVAAGAAAAFVVGVLVHVVMSRLRGAPGGGDASPHVDAPREGDPPVGPQTAFHAGGVVGTATMVLLPVALLALIAVGQADMVTRVWVGAALLTLFLALALAGGHAREADLEIAEAIKAEGPMARRVALLEVVQLLPALAVGVAVWALLAYRPDAATGWLSILRATPLERFAPVAGLVLAFQGAAIAAAAGWALRIFFTLIYGREALGVGDIYILAAAGAAAGWQIALLGLMASVAIALAGWIVSLALKRTTMIPLGPWLALGFLVALWQHEPASRFIGGQWQAILDAYHARPDSIWVMGGLLLVATAVALVVARLVRRLVEGPAESEGSPS